MSLNYPPFTRRHFARWAAAMTGAAAGLSTLRPARATAHTLPPGFARDFVGSWRLTVFPPAGQPHPGLITFAADGTLTAATIPTQPALPGAPFQIIVSSGGHGAWVPAVKGTTALTFNVLASNEQGEFFGTLTLNGTATLGAEGQTITSEFVITFTDSEGNSVSFGTGTFQGARIMVEPQA